MSGQLAFAVGDTVRVVGHYEWSGRDTHGCVGSVVEIAGGVDDAPHVTPWPLYLVDLPGWDVPVPLAADELELVGEPAGS